MQLGHLKRTTHFNLRAFSESDDLHTSFGDMGSKMWEPTTVLSGTEMVTTWKDQ